MKGDDFFKNNQEFLTLFQKLYSVIKDDNTEQK